MSKPNPEEPAERPKLPEKVSEKSSKRRLTAEDLKAVMFAVGVTVLSTPASADWQGTTWGNTVEETNKNFTIQHDDPTIGTTYDNHNGKMVLVYHGQIAFDEYAVDNFVFKDGALLFVGEDKLSAIRLSLKKPADCETLIAAMRSQYGTPVKEENSPFRENSDKSSHSITWYDPAHHNEVHVDYITWRKELSDFDTCEVIYTPLPLVSPGQR
jgi:hypothetical protein